MKFTDPAILLTLSRQNKDVILAINKIRLYSLFIMTFNKIIRIVEHPARADQSAMCAINRHLLYNRIILLKVIINLYYLERTIPIW